MKNRLQNNLYRIELLYVFLFIPVIGSCTSKIRDNRADSSNMIESTSQLMQEKQFPIFLKLDTTSQFQNKLIDPEDSLFHGNKKYLIHVSQSSEIGYVLFKMNSKFYVALIEWDNNFKVIGISEIVGLNKSEEYIELLYSESPINSVIFGIIKKKSSKIKTVRVWQINNSKKLIEEINPEKIDFTETYNTSTD